MDSNKQVMTLANSIIGVSVLAMPFCFKECGMLLSLLLLISSSILSRLTCYFLLKSAVLTRRRNYEFLAFHVYGPTGKLAVELFIIGFLIGTCVAFFVVMGDLSPQIISSMMGVKRASALRTTVMFAMALLVVLPLGLLRNVESLEFICTASIGFYLCLVIKVVAESTPHLIGSDWMNELRLWRPEGVLQCLPIFSMALFCQTQLFEVFGNLPNTSLDKMIEAVRTSINLCTVLYASVGFFGYIAFNTDKLTGNVLMSLEPTLSSEVIKIGFVLSVALSFPLVIFPCRASLYSLLYRNAHSMPHDYAGSHIPDCQFKLLTVSIVMVSLIIGVLLPNIETVLGLVGSTIGVTVCITLPAMLMHVIARQEGDRFISKITLAVGVIIMVLGTFSHLGSIDKTATLQEKNSISDNLAHVKSLGVAPILDVHPSPQTLQQEAENIKLKSPVQPQDKPETASKNTDTDFSLAKSSKLDIKKTDVVGNKENKPTKEENSKTLQKIEILKEVIQENKEEQEKLLKEQHQILESLKQHRREAEKLREKSELERKKQAAAQNASIEYKLKTAVLKGALVDKKEVQRVPVKLKEEIKIPDQVEKKKQPALKPIEIDVQPLVEVVPPETQQIRVVPNEVSKEKSLRTAVRAEVQGPGGPGEMRGNLKEPIKESVKSVNSQQEAPEAVNKVSSKEPAEQVRIQPPLPLPPQSKKGTSRLEQLENEAENSGAVLPDSRKMPPEPIPFVYQKKSSLVDSNQAHHREKREDRVDCEGSDFPAEKKPSSSFLPDLEPLKVRLEEHIQPQIKDSLL